VHLAIPSASLSIPSTDPLALLSGTAGLAPVRHRSAAPVTSPAIDVQAVKSTAASTFAPPAGRATLPSGETLPVTGTSDASLAVMAMVMVAAAFATRRFMFAR
jgi:hypothetical protein